MNADALFPPTQAERLAALASFVGEELGHRQHMLTHHPERADYWQARFDQARAALEHVEALTSDLP